MKKLMVIYIRQVSEENPTSRNSYNQQISTNYMTNHELKNGEWKVLFCPQEHYVDLQTQEAIKLIFSVYDLDMQIQLAFSYKTYMPSGKSSKWVRYTNDFLTKNRKITDKSGKV